MPPYNASRSIIDHDGETIAIAADMADADKRLATMDRLAAYAGEHWPTFDTDMLVIVEAMAQRAVCTTPHGATLVPIALFAHETDTAAPLWLRAYNCNRHECIAMRAIYTTGIALLCVPEETNLDHVGRVAIDISGVQWSA